MLPLTWVAKVRCLDELREWAPGTLACSPALGGLHPYGLSVRPRDGRCWFAPWPLLCVPSWGKGKAGTLGEGDQAWFSRVPCEDPRRVWDLWQGRGTNLSCRRWYLVLCEPGGRESEEESPQAWSLLTLRTQAAHPCSGPMEREHFKEVSF